MAYPDDQLKRSDPHAPQGRADPGPLGGARSGGSRLTGILVAVILILGVVFAVNLFLGGGETDTAPAAVSDTTDTTVPGDGAVAPATGGADDTAPVASDAPAE
ncbi:MAG: hypothetical protein CMI67_16570 [Pelagibaca sp.]|nr:hypothetical protein [Pelagibaca sp.]